MTKFFAQVLLPLALDESFTYAAGEDIEVGDIVLVEFGRKKIWGAVWALEDKLLEKISAEKIKPILEKNPSLHLAKSDLKFIDALASYNLASRGLVLRSFIGILNSDKVKKAPQKLIQKIESEKFRLKKLLPNQQKIFDEFQVAKPRVSLIDGVTGSGKTEIYFAIIAEILAKRTPQQVRGDKLGVLSDDIEENSSQLSPRTCCGVHSHPPQVLILLPEIALTSQLLLRFEEQFGFKPALWHSKISKKEKREIFYSLVDGNVRVLIGARSALLLPFKNLQLIVLDEEHDSSFKQQDVFNFHARDMAVLKASYENFSVVLSSATPALETYNNAVSSKYHHFILEQKFGQKNTLELLDLRQEKLESGNFLSQKLREEIAKNLEQKNQTLLFLNRRGYAPVLLCKSCAKKYECQNCDFHLVAHKAKNKLICHHCGHSETLQKKCKFCGEDDSLIALGAGVEKVFEEVEALFPQARIALITSDNVTSFVEADELVRKILGQEIDIIIGTQMIAKGYDFPDLTLIGVVDFDAMLYSSSLRALEKSYQMLTQLIGRAGRNSKAGKVIIQTYNPGNYLFEQIIKGDKKSFYDFELSQRLGLDLPPFAQMASFEVSSFLESDAKNFAKKLIQNFPINDKIEVFGPAPAPIQRLKNRHHFLVNLKVGKKINLQKLITDVTASLEIPRSVRLRIDVNPI